jgi:hypothetical protein
LPSLVSAKVRDDRPGRQQHQADGSQRHQNRRDVERGGQDQAHRSQDHFGFEAGGRRSAAIARRRNRS